MKQSYFKNTIILYFFIVACSQQLLFAQVYESTSPARRLQMSKGPTQPANLSASVTFYEPSGNKFLDADERGSIFITLKNSGKGKARKLQLAIEPQTMPNLLYIATKDIGEILSGEEKTIEIPLQADFNILSTQAVFTFHFTEAFGFEPLPVKFSFETKSFAAPMLTVVDGVGIEDANNNGMIEPGEVAKITVRVQNIGKGIAKDVRAIVHFGENVFQAEENKTNFLLGELAIGQYKDYTFALYTNNRAIGVPVTVDLTESYGKFGASNIALPLALNKPIKKMEEIFVQGVNDSSTGVERAGGLAVDVDINIPQALVKNENAVAVIFAISDYANPNVPQVAFAKRDGAVMRQYLEKTLGYDAKNILPQNPDEMMTVGTMKTFLKSKVPAYLKKDSSSDIFIYYTGHGAPSTTTNEAFFVPYDCDPSFVSDVNAYNMNEFYLDIAKLPARKKIVVIDACFSGQAGNGITLVQNASPALLKVKNALIADENSVLFQSSSAEQVSNWYPEKKHGMFTYFFLKGLQGAADRDNDSIVTAQELENYINDENNGLPYFSNREFQRPQKAMVTGVKEEIILKMKAEEEIK